MTSANNDKPYRPCSPDLTKESGFNQPPTLGRLPSYSRTPSESFASNYPFSPRQSIEINSSNAFHRPSVTGLGASYFGDQNQVQSPSSAVRTPTVAHQNFQANFNPYHANAQSPPRVPLYQDQPYHSTNYVQPYYDDEMARTRAQRSAEQQQQYPQEPLQPIPPPQSRAQPPPPPPRPASPEEPPFPTSATGLDIRTKFPVARIKRLMQADEEIGKVAQATPTAAAKALELFIATLTVKAATEARSANSKRITVGHLKAAIGKEKSFDFLDFICEKASDEGEKGEGKKKGRTKSEEDSDDDMEGIPNSKKKGRKASKEESE